MFVGIEFDEKNGGGVALIHSNWLTPRKREVWWPPFKQQEHYERSLKKGESPNENWLLYPVERTFFEEGKFSSYIKYNKLHSIFLPLLSSRCHSNQLCIKI